MAVVAFDSLGTLFDLGELEPRMPPVLHHGLSLAVVGDWVPLDDLAAALDPELAEGLPQLDPFDDAQPALRAVADAGAEAWVITNGGRDSTQQLLERAGLSELVAEVHSAEEVERYKPQAEVYELLPSGSTLVAAHAWDVVGAVRAGMRGVWVDRQRRGWPLPQEIAPHETAPDLLRAAELASGA